MSGYPGQGHYGAQQHSGGRGGFPPGQGPGFGYGYGNYGGPPQGPPQGNYGPPQGNYGPPQGNYGQPHPGNYGPPQGNYGPRPPSGPPPPGYGHNPQPQYARPPPAEGNYAMRAQAGPPPPTAPQHFGHGAPQGYTFQYSNCTGRRKALLIGINYFGQKGELRGCINDVHNVSQFLIAHYGYKREDMVILTDDQQNPVMRPTKDNMLRAMGWLVKDARPNDSLFFHFSGEQQLGSDNEFTLTVYRSRWSD